MFDDDTRRRIRAVAIPLPPPSDSVALSAWLRRSALVAKLKQRFAPGADSATLARLVTFLLHDGGFGAGPNLIDTWAAIDILQTCGAPLRLPGLSQFVDRLQISHPLFDTTSTAGSARGDVLWAGVGACRALGVPIRYALDACEFVLACQSAHGGFANAPQELPDIESTYRAIEILLELKPAA
ncbi:MAG TPA: hypothetical protein VFR86_20180 [Burkholderiaceae bacterium]|nr:hypothetical protein [Burkholderiaceae bacterium]